MNSFPICHSLLLPFLIFPLFITISYKELIHNYRLLPALSCGPVHEKNNNITLVTVQLIFSEIVIMLPIFFTSYKWRQSIDTILFRSIIGIEEDNKSSWVHIISPPQTGTSVRESPWLYSVLTEFSAVTTSCSKFHHKLLLLWINI